MKYFPLFPGREAVSSWMSFMSWRTHFPLVTLHPCHVGVHWLQLWTGEVRPTPSSGGQASPARVSHRGSDCTGPGKGRLAGAEATREPGRWTSDGASRPCPTLSPPSLLPAAGPQPGRRRGLHGRALRFPVSDAVHCLFAWGVEGLPILPTQHAGPPPPAWVIPQLNSLHAHARIMTAMEIFCTTEPWAKLWLCGSSDTGLFGFVGFVFYAFPFHKCFPNPDRPGECIRYVLVPHYVFPGPSALPSSWPAVCPEQPPWTTRRPRNFLHGKQEALVSVVPIFLSVCSSVWWHLLSQSLLRKGQTGLFYSIDCVFMPLTHMIWWVFTIFPSELVILYYFVFSVRISSPSCCVSFNFFVIPFILLSFKMQSNVCL